MTAARVLPNLLLFLATTALADINLHNPRGSNNRLNEDKRERRNPNRLFNSQNNNRGGHNVGVDSLRYYSGSKLRIEWANQHSCGDENNNCELIIQYMCGDNLRDGARINTVPENRGSCRRQNCDTDERFGLHESYNYFRKCTLREKNSGLFTADQKLGKSARSTRQNRKGTRYGYECQEERDYYPYWAPTPWKDIAIFTNNPERCAYYQQESQNVKAKHECTMDEQVLQRRWGNQVKLHLNKRDCMLSTQRIGRSNYRGQWVESPAHGIAAPDCLKSPWSRDNHQGNTMGGEFMSYDWTVPDLDDEKCVIRIRYNISTNDFDSWNTDATENNPRIIWEKFGLREDEAKQRQYELRTNPNLKVVDRDTEKRRKKKSVRLQLAVDTAQFGRTFQDRSHVFRVLRRPTEYGDAVIHNVNVRGKRGNIVQVYPSTEYDFVPTKLQASVGDMVHFQWTGSDSNPRNNDGQGKAKTDRSNVVQLASRTFPKSLLPLSVRNISLGTNYKIVNRKWNFLGLGWQATEELALLERGGGNDPELNRKSAYFDLGPQYLREAGTCYYMSTRNNAFSNRDQKASVQVAEETYNPGDRGASYRGFVSVTTSGKTCQRWDSQSPHEHPFDPRDKPGFGLEANFCRNPNNRGRPWCFTTDSNTKWEFCAVPRANAGRKRKSIEEVVSVFPKADKD